MAVRIQLRGDTATNWTATNPVLAAREPGLETDTRKWKFGDGNTAWNLLQYAAGGTTGGGGTTGLTNLDGGTPSSTYGGTTAIDGGTP